MKIINRHNIVLTTLILTFTLPVLMAGFLYWHGPFSSHTTNYGQLVQPSVSINELTPTDTANQPLPIKDLRGKWVLLVVNPAHCDQACEQGLYAIRQISKATGKDQTRLRQVVLTLRDQKIDAHLEARLEKEYPLVKHWVCETDKLQKLSGLPHQNLDSEQGAIYFIDPLGNIMMRYPPMANSSGILKDLSKLLRVSQIG